MRSGNGTEFMNQQTALRQEIVKRLREIIDPEIGVNIVDLGLIYDIRVTEEQIAVDYTTTTPGCPLRRFIEQQIIVAVNGLATNRQTQVRFAESPPWSVDMPAGDISLFSSPTG